MRKSKYSEHQIVGALKRAEADRTPMIQAMRIVGFPLTMLMTDPMLT